MVYILTILRSIAPYSGQFINRFTGTPIYHCRYI